jgi:hypothetical protein
LGAKGDSWIGEGGALGCADERLSVGWEGEYGWVEAEEEERSSVRACELDDAR